MTSCGDGVQPTSAPPSERAARFFRPMSPPPSTLDPRTDRELRASIVDEQSGWQDAYEALVHGRYGPVVDHAIESALQRYGADLARDEILERLFTHLRGPDAAWTNLKSWAPERGPLRAWLWVVTRNLVRRLLRRSNSHPDAHPLSPTGERTDDAWEATPPAEAPPAEDVVTVALLLERMKPECRDLLRLKYFVGLTDADIGAERNISREWANRKRRRCERHLARLLDREGLVPEDFSF